jgi:hypothetical protein
MVLMGRDYPRQLSMIKLTPAERALLDADGQAVVHRPVEWVISCRVPRFEAARVDRGGTAVWGPGPYLKVPDRDPRDGEDYVDRVFCPWGYPPRSIRVSHRKIRLTLLAVELTHSGPAEWEWLLTVKTARIQAKRDLL